VDLTNWEQLVGQYVQCLPPSADKPERQLAVVMRVGSEEQARMIAKALEQSGFTRINVERRRFSFRKRWNVTAASTPVPYAAEELRKWLRSMCTFAQEHGASLDHWVPLALSSEEL
jgi:hypothetical protein